MLGQSSLAFPEFLEEKLRSKAELNNQAKAKKNENG